MLYEFFVTISFPHKLFSQSTLSAHSHRFLSQSIPSMLTWYHSCYVTGCLSDSNRARWPGLSTLALQRVFYQLQTSDQSVGTTELTKSFGWKSLDAFLQHDVQEFSRVLQDKLESKMKGTPADGAIQHLFAGKYKTYLKCINVDYESSREESFFGLAQLL